MFDYYTSAQVFAGCVLAGLVVGATVAVIKLILNSPHNTFLTILYWVDQFIVRIQWRGTASGPLPVADNQGAIIVGNHRSGIDPLVMQLTTPRLIHWMVAREYVAHWSLAWILRQMQAIPVGRRGVDTAATKAAIRLASEGGLVGMFPEGTVNSTDQLLLPCRPGAILVALKARVPIIPCYISGSPFAGEAIWSFFMTARAHIEVGPLIDISEYYGREREPAVVEKLTRQVLHEIVRLAGQPNYPIQLAGRRWGLSELSDDRGEEVPEKGPAKV